MKSFGQVVFGILALAMVALGDPRPWMRDLKPQAKEPWLGVNFGWVDQVTASHLKHVPQGFGLVVESVESAGPAETAGVQPLDVLWKVDDQLVANRGQLVCLMRLKGVGASMNLHVARGGESVEIPVTLSERPQAKEQARVTQTLLTPPIPGLPLPKSVRWVNYDQRTAFLEDGDRTFSVSRDKEGFRYSISSGEDEVGKGHLQSELSEQWPEEIDSSSRQKLEILVRSLVNAENREARTKRLPRVRRVPTPQKQPQATAKN